MESFEHVLFAQGFDWDLLPIVFLRTNNDVWCCAVTFTPFVFFLSGKKVIVCLLPEEKTKVDRPRKTVRGNSAAYLYPYLDLRRDNMIGGFRRSSESFCAVLVALSVAVVLGENVRAPDFYRVQFKTDIGENAPIVIEVNRTWAPLGADHFYSLVQGKFYDNSALFRVVPKFVLQFGISGNSSENKKWLHNNIQDDPVLVSNTQGTVTYADAGPNTRTTQIFINYGDNARLDKLGFCPFGKVTSGLDVARRAFNPTVSIFVASTHTQR